MSSPASTYRGHVTARSRAHMQCGFEESTSKTDWKRSTLTNTLFSARRVHSSTTRGRGVRLHNEAHSVAGGQAAHPEHRGRLRRRIRVSVNPWSSTASSRSAILSSNCRRRLAWAILSCDGAPSLLHFTRRLERIRSSQGTMTLRAPKQPPRSQISTATDRSRASVATSDRREPRRPSSRRTATMPAVTNIRNREDGR